MEISVTRRHNVYSESIQNRYNVKNVKEYCTVARRYEFMFEWQEQCLTQREHKIHIFEPTCNVLVILLIIFILFPTTFRGIPKILQNLSEGHMNVAEHFQKFPGD